MSSASTVIERPVFELERRPRLESEVIRLGGTGLNICYQCGSCTAICPISDYFDISFRRTIKYVQLGLDEHISADLSPWLCYQCGECNDTCPREAYPGEIMMALRRYKTIKDSIFGVSRFLYSGGRLIISILILSLLAAVGILFNMGPLDLGGVDIYSFMPYHFVHDAGIVLAFIIGVSVLVNIYSMYRGFRDMAIYNNSYRPHILDWVRGFISIIKGEALTQGLFTKCSDSRGRYLAHLSLFYGFLGLFIATSLHYVDDLTGIYIDVVYPRTIGIVSGLFLMYGTIYYIYKRLRGDSSNFKFSYITDWVFLLLLFLVGITGFLTTLFLYMGWPMATYVMYGAHLITVFDLLVLAPFTKFMHSLYRPFAILLYNLYYGGGRGA
jgi:ferredoxin